MMNLIFKTQNYDWGKLGETSRVAQLAKAANCAEKIQKDVPYAELWMGTHPNGPSTIAKTGQSLLDYINKHPECLGSKIMQNFGKELPFLFKVLSIAKALSIQAHPDKNHAEILHKNRPDLYKDPNHKPELAIAVTPFEAMCGFRPVEEITHFLQTVPELITIIGHSNVTKFLTSNAAGQSKALKDCFHSFMTQCPSIVTQQLQLLLKRVSNLDESVRNDQQAPLIERLNEQFPNDIGCFSVYFLNIITLQPGEALYLGPNEPHAYLSGDCIECMACSDNVVRAGLTPKFKDVETLCNMLTYLMDKPSSKLFQPKTENKFTNLYAPPVKDFAVAKIKISVTSETIDLITRDSASIIIVIEGQAQADNISLRRGSVYFVPAYELIKVDNVTSDLLMFQAFANV